MRKSQFVLAGLGLGFALVGFSFADAAAKRAQSQARLVMTADMIERLELTDLVLFTEARYARHPAVSDRFSAFQDHPMALEHFPSGSALSPPRHLRQGP